VNPYKNQTLTGIGCTKSYDINKGYAKNYSIFISHVSSLVI